MLTQLHTPTLTHTRMLAHTLGRTPHTGNGKKRGKDKFLVQPVAKAWFFYGRITIRGSTANVVRLSFDQKLQKILFLRGALKQGSSG